MIVVANQSENRCCGGVQPWVEHLRKTK